MVKRSSFLILFGIFATPVCFADSIQMKWGLENTWSYTEQVRTQDQNLAQEGAVKGKGYRTFAFMDSNETVVQPMLQCFKRHQDIWEKYSVRTDTQKSREDFNRYKADRDPFCVQNARRQAPTLYFDFVGKSNQQYILERIEVTTIAFEEYRGGGFADKQAWYDVILSHLPGLKSYEIEPRLVFSGTGRAVLRFWSDNFYPSMGWMAPMGEYTLKVNFIFSTDNGKENVSTEIFKLDV